MEELKTEYILFDKCKCCLGDGALKEMWGEYMFDDRKEVYGDMVMECFSIQFQQPPNPDNHVEQICDSCVVRLRDALDFKREVLACEQLRYEHLTNGIIIKLEPEDVEIETEVDGNEMELNGGEMELHEGEIELREGEMELLEGEPYVMDYSVEVQSEEYGESEVDDYEDVQYLEIEDVDAEEKPRKPKTTETKAKRLMSPTPQKRAKRLMSPTPQKRAKRVISPTPQKPTKRQLPATRQRTREINQENIDSEESRRKWPRKKKRHEKLKLYKQYTRDDMMNALEAVNNGSLSKSEASKQFNVPRKTLTAKLQLAKNPASHDGEKEEKNRRYFKFIDEIRTILRYTNAIPFKTVTARFYCAYCSTDGPHFEEPEELRIHTRTKHVDERIKGIEMALRPHWQNEVLKVDIDALHCTVCCTVLPNWNEMFKHLEETHKIELDEAYTKIIPYKLDRDYKCALCNEGFPNYHHLDSHMNAHYFNHICPECGDTFLSISRMNKHVQVHMTGKFPCEACGKVFSRDNYRQKHFDHVHKQEHNIKCLYCTEKFYGLYQRHLHVVANHKEKVKMVTCEFCGLRFDWKPYYLAHMRRKHNIKKEL